MKKFLFRALLVFAVTIAASASCFSQSRKEKKAAKAAAVSQFVTKSIKEKSLYVSIYKICPLSAYPQNSDYGFYISLQDGKFSCYLPYIGTSKTAQFATDAIGISAKNQPVSLNGGFNGEEKSFIYQFQFVNDGTHENSLCTIQLFDNAEVNIRIESNSREAIAYKGTLIEKPTSEPKL